MLRFSLKPKSSSEGFTIIEALIAMAILSVGLLAMGSLLVSIMGYNKSAGHVTAATTLAQDKIEELKNTFYDSISTTTTTENDIDAEGNAGGIYDRETQVAADTPGPNMKEVNVTVSYTWKGAQSVSLKTIIAK